MILGTFKRRAAPFLSGERHTFSTVLVAILMKAYGTAVLNWDGASIQIQTKADFGVEMPRKVYDQLMALITALTTDQVYTDVEVFDTVCGALCRKGLSSHHSIPPVLDIAWAVTEIEMADPEPIGREKNRWDDDIKRYIRVALTDEGISMAPKTLSFVKSLPPSTTETSDPAIFAASWLGKQDAADEIDAQIEQLTQTLLKHLREAGMASPVSVKFASVPEIVKVDGGKVRDTIDNDFVGGGHSEVFDEIPDDQIWVEKSFSEDDQKKIVLHEIIEKSLMKQDGLSYDKAHGIASDIEARVRGSPNVNPKIAEWTSDANRDAHVAKHGPEFGSPENYLAAEEEHAAGPAGDEVPKDVRCKIRPNGEPDCTMSYHSATRGTLHVKRLKDGKTVTLYKVTT